MTKRAIIWCAVSTKAQTDEDKYSLPDQERIARAFAERSGWRVVDVLRVPGHSRHYIDIHECAADMAAQGIDAFVRLLEHWRQRDFDVLIVRDGDRFARTQTLHAYVTERTIETGATIYSIADGPVDQSNFRMWIAMVGYRAAHDIDRLVDAHRKGMDVRAAKGLPTSSKTLRFFKVLRDENGKAVKLIVDPASRRMLDDLATLILEGVSWNRIETELAERFGHVDLNGRQYYPNTMMYVVMNPTFHGHTARNFRNERDGRSRGAWMFDPSEPPPEHVKIYYNTHEPAYTGDLALRIQAELRRRMLMTGRRRPTRTKMFSGLLLCEECGYMLGYGRSDGTHELYRCMARWASRRLRSECGQRKSISSKNVYKYINRILQLAIDGQSPEWFQRQDGTATQERIAQLKSEIAELQEQSRRLVAKQAIAPPDLNDVYDEQIGVMGERLRRLKLELARQHHEQERTNQRDAEQVIADIRAEGLENFWKRDETDINRILHRLFGKNRFTVKDGKIVGWKPYSRRR